jgi:hypothetical protein
MQPVQINCRNGIARRHPVSENSSNFFSSNFFSASVVQLDLEHRTLGFEIRCASRSVVPEAPTAPDGEVWKYRVVYDDRQLRLRVKDLSGFSVALEPGCR